MARDNINDILVFLAIARERSFTRAAAKLGMSGLIRITANDHVIENVLFPRLAKLLPQYPDIHLEINSDYRMVDIAAERYDIGVRWATRWTRTWWRCGSRRKCR